jgi:hypothetical protein
MTLLEVIKEAEKKQKSLDACGKVYIRRKSWENLIDPVSFRWFYGEPLFKKS